jgi:hypothetical protein
MLGGELAEALLAAVHDGGDLGQVGLPSGVGEFGDTACPGALRLGEQRTGTLADPGIDHRGDVPRAGQVPGGDRRPGDLGWVQAGQLRRAQRPVQPPGLMRQFLPVLIGERGHDQVLVAGVVGLPGFGSPDRAQDGEVVGAGQVAGPGLGRRELGAVAAEDVGEHRDRLPRVRPIR